MSASFYQASTGSRRQKLLVGAAAVLLLLLPVALTQYQTFQATMILLYAIALLGLNMLVGYNGQISIGHGAFFAIGAYVTAISVSSFGIPYWATIPIAGLVCLVIGILFGIPALRLEGHYLALATFGLALALPQILKLHAFEAWTKGVSGLFVRKPKAPFGLPLTPDQWLYYFTLFFLALAFLFAANLLRGRIGQAMIAIRDQPAAASSMGVNVSYYKTMTFGLSALYTGVAGALSAVVVQFVAPDSFNLQLSISFLLAIVVGGLGTMWGALFGAAFMVIVPNLASEISTAAPWAIYGVAVIIFMYVMPSGLVGLVRKIWRSLAQSPAARSTP